MQLHAPTFPKCNPIPPKFWSPTLFFIHGSPKNPTFNPDFASGFSNSAKRVLKSQARFRNGNGLIGVKCEVSEARDKDDGFYMRRCVELARKAVGYTSPNPMVGCVIAKDGQIVGQGFHPKAGQPHAEVFALRDAGNLAEDATAYVSLEPCNHYGRTPPCTGALIEAKVKKVVVGMVDPNPIVASKGVERLRAAGIDVTVGVEEELCKRLNEAYIHHMLTRKPFITLRYSLSINGCLRNELGEGATESGGYYSQLLQEYDAIISFPTSLTKFSFHESQEPGANQPLQILIARNPSYSIEIPVSQTASTSKIIIFTDKETDTKPETTRNGVELVVLDSVNLDAVLEYCNRQGMCSILLDLRENFGEFEEFIGKNMLQKVVIEVLPVWDDVSEEQRLRLALKNLEAKLRLKNAMPRISNGSILIEGYFL